jgi:hypothetical protein
VRVASDGRSSGSTTRLEAVSRRRGGEDVGRSSAVPTSIWRKLLLAAGGIALTLAALEVALSLFSPQRTVAHVLANHAAMYRVGDVVPFELIPGFRGREREQEGEFDVAVEINSQGHRQGEIGPKAAGELRIVAIGDSFTYGEGVEGEEAWPRALERALVQGSPRPVRVVNAGVPGRWVDEYYLELRGRALALDPDVVLIGFFVGNDVDGEDARAHVWSRVDARDLPEAVSIPGLRIENGHRVRSRTKSRWRLPIVRDSHVAQLFFDGGKAIHEAWSPPALAEEAAYAPETNPEAQRATDRVERLMLAMADLCRAHGIAFAVVMIPAREQVMPELARRSQARDWEKPQRHFRAFFERSDIPFVDLLPAVRAAREDAPLYYRFDAHWTARGHALAAASVAEFLEARRLAEAVARP